jgi:hypothetical protein
MRFHQQAVVLFLALVTILLTNFLGHAANTIIYFPFTNGYIDPVTRKYTAVGEVRNDSPTQKPIGDVIFDVQFVAENETVLAFEQVQVSKLTPLGAINVPYRVPVPFKVVLDDVALSQKVKYADAGLRMLPAKYKPADLLLLSNEIYLQDSNEFGKKWGVRGEIRNNYSLPAKNVYVIASLYNAAESFIGVAGFDSTDRHPVRIEPMQTGRYFLSTWLPSDRVPVKAVIHAESEQSILRSPYYFPLLPEHKMTDDEGSWITSIHVGEKAYFMSNITNISRDDKEFYWILQIKKLPNEDPLPLPDSSSGFATEHLKTLQYKVQSGKSAPLEYTWIPEQEGHYFFEIFIWSDMDKPVPLSYAHTYMFYTPTMFVVSK